MKTRCLLLVAACLSLSASARAETDSCAIFQHIQSEAANNFAGLKAPGAMSSAGPIQAIALFPGEKATATVAIDAPSPRYHAELPYSDSTKAGYKQYVHALHRCFPDATDEKGKHSSFDAVVVGYRFVTEAGVQFVVLGRICRRGVADCTEEVSLDVIKGVDLPPDLANVFRH